MSRESGGRRGRRLFLAGLVLALIPMTTKPPEQSACDADSSLVNSLVCTPIELARIAIPLLRQFVQW